MCGRQPRTCEARVSAGYYGKTKLSNEIPKSSPIVTVGIARERNRAASRYNTAHPKRVEWRRSHEMLCWEVAVRSPTLLVGNAPSRPAYVLRDNPRKTHAPIEFAFTVNVKWKESSEQRLSSSSSTDSISSLTYQHHPRPIRPALGETHKETLYLFVQVIDDHEVLRGPRGSSTPPLVCTSSCSLFRPRTKMVVCDFRYAGFTRDWVNRVCSTSSRSKLTRSESVR